jgi:hypothetical protein
MHSDAFADRYAGCYMYPTERMLASTQISCIHCFGTLLRVYAGERGVFFLR